MHISRKHFAPFPEPTTSPGTYRLPAPNHRLTYIKSHHSLPTAACNQLLPSEQALLTPSFPCSFIKGCLVSFVFQDCFQSHWLLWSCAQGTNMQGSKTILDIIFSLWTATGFFLPREAKGLHLLAMDMGHFTWTIYTRKGVCVTAG